MAAGDEESESIERGRWQRNFDARRVSMLAKMDAAFAKRVLDLDAVRQRKLAAWAARWACHFADVDTRPEVARALQYLDDEGRLPEPFNDHRVATALLRPQQPEPGILKAYIRPVGEGSRIPLAPWAAAFDATRSADNANPAAAAVNALIGACEGQVDPTQLLTDAGHYIESMA